MSVRSGGSRGFRTLASEIGTSAPTLSRIESGKMPDLQTFGKLFRWLELDPATLLDVTPQPAETAPPHVAVAHLKATASPDTADQHSRHLRTTPAKTHGQQASLEGNAEGTTTQVSRQTRRNNHPSIEANPTNPRSRQTGRNGLSRNVPRTRPRNARNT